MALSKGHNTSKVGNCCASFSLAIKMVAHCTGFCSSASGKAAYMVCASGKISDVLCLKRCSVLTHDITTALAFLIPAYLLPDLESWGDLLTLPQSIQ